MKIEVINLREPKKINVQVSISAIQTEEEFQQICDHNINTHHTEMQPQLIDCGSDIMESEEYTQELSAPSMGTDWNYDKLEMLKIIEDLRTNIYNIDEILRYYIETPADEMIQQVKDGLEIFDSIVDSIEKADEYYSSDESKE